MLLIVNTSSDRKLGEEFKDLTKAKSVVIDCSDLDIKPCIGCNCCWLKTPGECSIKDDYNNILKQIPEADQLWVISDTALGFIDHKGKNVFDRIIPILDMYLEFRGGQMRHILRYDQKTDIGLIVNGEADMDYLGRWCKRVALNIDSNSLGVYRSDALKEAASCTQKS